MKTADFLMLLTGLSLFLYGMQMMEEGLLTAAGDRMKKLIAVLAGGRARGVLIGTLVTAVIQSSSAMTVMVVGFVNSGMMTLYQAVWIIMGANIGTTVTGQLIALNLGALAPILAFTGVILVVFVKRPAAKCAGEMLAGLGVLLIGMEIMGRAMLPLQNSPLFLKWMTTFQNPFIGVLAGTVFTALIQSSSASVGILQMLASSGMIGLGDAVYVVCGQNIGTCVTAMLAAIGTSTDAKRTTVIHVLFNVIGTVIFIALCVLTPFTDLVRLLSPENPSMQIANIHTIFNVVTTLVLLPFGKRMADWAVKILPDRSPDNRVETAKRRSRK